MAEEKPVQPENENIDEAIQNQQRAIELEIANRQNYLVNSSEEVKNLKGEYYNDEDFLKRIETLEEEHDAFRRTRADGNCFYRAFGFAVFEHVMKDMEAYKKLKEKCAELRNALLEVLGYQQFTVDDFYDTFVEELDKACTSEGYTVTQLEDLFNDQALSNYMVVFFRLMTSAKLQLEEDFYINFLMDGLPSVKDFCSLEVEPIDKDTDHIQIMALTSGLDICVRIFCMERGQHSTVTFPSEGEPVIHLLYRPGHYDILYKKRST